MLATAGTISFSVVRSGGTTLSVAGGNYQPSAVRIANNNSVSVFIQFGDSTATIGVNTGMEILPNSVETFKIAGMPFLSHISNGTATICVTAGEGI